MASGFHVGVDDQRQRSVKDIIHQFDPSKAAQQPRPKTYQTWDYPLIFTITAIASVAATYVFANLLTILLGGSCHTIWRLHIAEFGDFTSQSIIDRCSSTIQWFDWCDTQFYCKPLVRLVEWLA